MAYIRWSDESDIYCYHHVNDKFYVILANNRPILGKSMEDFVNEPTLSQDMSEGEFYELYYQYHTPIGLKHDGETFEEKTLVDMLKRIEYLLDLGYKAPKENIDRIKAKIERGDED